MSRDPMKNEKQVTPEEYAALAKAGAQRQSLDELNALGKAPVKRLEPQRYAVEVVEVRHMRLFVWGDSNADAAEMAIAARTNAFATENLSDGVDSARVISIGIRSTKVISGETTAMKAEEIRRRRSLLDTTIEQYKLGNTSKVALGTALESYEKTGDHDHGAGSIAIGGPCHGGDCRVWLARRLLAQQ